MEANVQSTWKPIVAGILDIVGGALSAFGFIGTIVGILFFIPVATSVGSGPVPEIDQWLFPGVLETILVIAAIYLLIVSVVPIIAGIYALQRKKWGLALAGSIVAIFGSTLFGILATIFTAMAKDEFE